MRGFRLAALSVLLAPLAFSGCRAVDWIMGVRHRKVLPRMLVLPFDCDCETDSIGKDIHKGFIQKIRNSNLEVLTIKELDTLLASRQAFAQAEAERRRQEQQAEAQAAEAQPMMHPSEGAELPEGPEPETPPAAPEASPPPPAPPAPPAKIPAGGDISPADLPLPGTGLLPPDPYAEKQEPAQVQNPTITLDEIKDADLSKDRDLRKKLYTELGIRYLVLAGAKEQKQTDLELGNLKTAEKARMIAWDLSTDTVLCDEDFKQGFFEIVAPDRIGRKLASPLARELKRIRKKAQQKKRAQPR